MSLQWADFPSGQEGLYDTTASLMLNGTPWVALVGATIVADPDSANFPNGRVLRNRSATNGPTDATRLAVTTPHQKMGVGFRTYNTGLLSETQPFVALNSTGNAVRYALRIRPNGGIELLRGSTVIATADYPILFANSWHHVEINADSVTGVVEVRKNGVTIPELSITDGSPPGGTIGIVAFPANNAGAAFHSNLRTKDIVVYNGAGTEVNSFQGSVLVYDSVPDSDITLGGWTLSSGSTGYSLIDESPPVDTGYISADSTPPADAEFTLTDLPVDVTSVRGIIPIVRALKTDGGDGNLQMSLSPNGTDYADGTDRAVNTTATYFHDVSELSPATGVAWTPTEVNNLRIRFSRTV